MNNIINGTTASTENLQFTVKELGDTISKLKSEKTKKGMQILVKSLELDYTILKGLIDSLDKD